MIVLCNNSEERDIVINYLCVKKGIDFNPENMLKDACFVIETERGIVVTDKPEYISFHQRKTNESITPFIKFVKEIMLGHIYKLAKRNELLIAKLATYRDITNKQNKQIALFQQIFQL